MGAGPLNVWNPIMVYFTVMQLKNEFKKKKENQLCKQWISYWHLRSQTFSIKRLFSLFMP